MISCFVQYWCKLLIWGAVEFIAGSSQSLIRRAAPGDHAGILHKQCHKGVCVLGLCLDIQHHKNKATGEVVLGGMYLKAVWVRISIEGSCCV